MKIKELLKPTKPKLKGFLFFIVGLFLFNLVHYAINLYIARKYSPEFYGIFQASYSWIFTILSFIWIYLLICIVFSMAKKKSLFSDLKPTRLKILILILFGIVWLFSKVRGFLWEMYVKSQPVRTFMIVTDWTGIILFGLIPFLLYLFLVYVFISIIYLLVGTKNDTHKKRKKQEDNLKNR